MLWIRFLSLAVIAVITSAYDLRQRRAPDFLTLGGTVLCLVLAGIEGKDAFVASAVGAAIGGLILCLSRLAARGGLGWGDVKAGLLLGSGLGARLVLPALFAAALVSLLFAGTFKLAGKYSRGSAVPFVPFLACGALLVIGCDITLPAFKALFEGALL